MAEAPLFRQLLEQAAGGALSGWPEVEAGVRLCRPAAGATLFDPDQVHPYLYAVRSGLVKLCYLDAEGREWIKSFAEEGRFFASIAALAPGGRTGFAAVALEPCCLERLDHRVVARLAQHDLAWARASAAMTLTFAARKELRERELLTLDGEGRYRAFAAAHPALLGRIPQKDLARHLGLTPVGLNRIVMRLRRAAGAPPLVDGRTRAARARVTPVARSEQAGGDVDGQADQRGVEQEGQHAMRGTDRPQR